MASSTVTGPDIAMADAPATGLLAAGTEALGHLAARPGYEALLIGHDRAFRRTDGFRLTPVPAT